MFERPSEAVVFWVLENLCQNAGGKCKITFADLARRCSLAQSTVKRVVHGLAKRRVIRFQAGCNQYQGSVYEIVYGSHEILKGKQILKQVQDDGEGGDTRGMVQGDGDSIALNTGLQNDEVRGRVGVRAGGGKSAGADVSQSRSAGPKIGQPNLRDISSITNDLYIGDIHDRRVVHTKQGDGDPSEEERLAFQVADGLGDVKNLRLYESYCKRYPTEIILTAYVRAREVSPDKIKKSRGALFNFLVQKYGGKNKNQPKADQPLAGKKKSGYSGSASWSARDGRGCAGSR